MFTGKNLLMTPKKLHALILSEKAWCSVLKIDAYARPLSTKSFDHDLLSCEVFLTKS